MALLSVSITKPLPGDSFTGNSPDVAVTVTGEAHGTPDLPAAAKVYVRLGANAAWQAVTGLSTWSFTGSLLKSGLLEISAKVVDEGPGLVSIEQSTQVSVSVLVDVKDITKPDLTVKSPANGTTISRYGSVARVSVTIAVIDRNSGLQRVSVYLDGRRIRDRALDVESWSGVEEVEVAADSNVNRILKIEAMDQAGNLAEISLALLDPDVLSPDIQIVSPTEGGKLRAAATIDVAATVTDLQSGVGEVEWSLDGGPFSALVSLSSAGSSWQAELPMPPAGVHQISVRAKDKAGNRTAKVVNFEVARPYQPKNAEDLLTSRAYLEDLLWFAETHLVGKRNTPVSAENLEKVFFQPFARLIDAALPLGDQPVNQVRACIEVLRQYPAYIESGLVAHWKLDEGVGTTAADATGNVADALLRGATWSTGKTGSALMFDGQSNRVEVPDSKALTALETALTVVGIASIPSSFGIAFWAYPLSPINIDIEAVTGVSGTSGQRYAFGPQQGGVAFGSPDHAGVGISVGTNCVSVYEHSDNYLPAVLVYETKISGWTHIAVTYEYELPPFAIFGTPGNWRAYLYIDGKFVKAGQPSPKTVLHCVPTDLGGSKEGYGYYHGQLDDIRVYKSNLGGLSKDFIALLARSTDPAAESGYAFAAYQSLLRRIGTSYEEIRLVRGADDDTRKALGARLGVNLDPVRPDPLDKLFLTHAQVTEEALEALFGLVNTGHDPLQSVDDPLLLKWKRANLRRLWMQQDHPDLPQPAVNAPIIDPDLIDREDLRHPVPHDSAYDLWLERKVWLQTVFADLKSQPTTGAGLNTNLTAVLGKSAEDLTNLAIAEKQGTNITSTLNLLHLTRIAFQQLLRLSALVGTGIVTDEEWEDLRHILVQVKKNQVQTDWIQAEQQLTLSPESFVISLKPWKPVTWRSTFEARQSWQDQLQARIDQDGTLQGDLNAILQGVEETTLYLLRDGFQSVIALQSLDQLTERLFIDVNGAGSQMTTRVLQAIQTLQQVIISVRSGRFPVGHPADNWRIEPTLTQSDFDEEWKWMGSYDAWRAAIYFFNFPETLLLPSLRPPDRTTPEFAALLTAQRAKQRLSAEDARELAAQYLEDVRRNGLVGYWKFNDGIGQQAADSSSKANAATIVGATWSSDANGKAVLAFDGVDDYAQVPHSAAIEVGKGGADFTVSFSLFLRQDATGQWRTLLHKGAADLERTFALYLRPDNNGVSFRISTSVYPDHGSESNKTIPLFQWTHITYQKIGSRLHLYINGELDGEHMFPVLGSGDVVSNAGPLYIGKDPWGAGVNALIKDVRIYNPNYPEGSAGDLAVRGYPLPSQLLAPFNLTEQQSKDDLERRRILSAMMANQINYKKLIPTPEPSDFPYVKEIFYFVPMQLAVTLQKSGEYVAALDWYRTVYAYNVSDLPDFIFPVDERKIYSGLSVEINGVSNLSRNIHWLRDQLNPHILAEQRSNPYTRFTFICIARCFLEYADSEFTRDTGESVATARSLYLAARDLLASPELSTPGSIFGVVVLTNPILGALRTRAEIQLRKLHEGRNIMGMKRQVEMYTSATAALQGGSPAFGSAGQLVVPGATAFRPTPYRFSVLMERSKQLANLSQQIEGAYLAAIERRDAAAYDRLKAGFDLDLAAKTEDLHTLRVNQARDSTELAQRQKRSAEIRKATYDKWIVAGPNTWERSLVTLYKMATFYRTAIGIADAVANLGSSFSGLAGIGKAGNTWALAGVEEDVQIYSLRASQARRQDEWELQKSLANQDTLIGDQQILIAQDSEVIASREAEIAKSQTFEARTVADFLASKFTNTELYEWMTGVLTGVYRYFLQQATATAQLAQNQLAFERQQTGANFIQADYWEAPADTGTNGKSPDRRGLTGSARLLQDIYQLDQFAFESDKRKLNLTQTFSLARMAPLEFEEFRETGVLPFATPTRLFDQSFPGHYLRLIKRVRTSVIALIPPTEGIRATLVANGVSRAVIGGDVFQEAVIRRDPELVSFTSAANATGVFDLDLQSEMLLPFESMGVDTTWEFRLPKAANAFDYRTIADVLVTIEYTALNDLNYYQQVVQTLGRRVSAERSFSFRDQFTDAWYDLNNPDQVARPMAVQFSTRREDFPPNVRNLRISHVLVYFPQKPGTSSKLSVVSFVFKADNGQQYPPLNLTSAAVSTDEGIISTRTGNWSSFVGAPSVIGTWELTLQENMKSRFQQGEIEDILFVITYSGDLAEWPL